MQTSQTEEIQDIVQVVHFQWNPLFVPSPSVSANNVASSSAHMQTLAFACFLLVVVVKGESTAFVDFVSCQLDE